MNGTAEPTREQMEKVQARIEGYGFKVHVGG